MACCLHAFHKDGDGIIIGYEMGITYLFFAEEVIEIRFQGREG
jgi:hypothetical protein